jgi:serine protease Do
MRKFIAFGPAMVVLLTAFVTLFAAPAAVRFVGYANTENQIALAQNTLEGENILKQIDRAVRSIADAVEPCVVHVGVEGSFTNGWQRGRFASQGSGWVYDKLGHIVTNAHVIQNAQRISVQFYDGRAATAEVLGQDRDTDIAVLKVNVSEGLFPVLRATKYDLHQGDRVYAFGSPFGFKFSMSEGIISGLGRDPQQILASPTGYTNFIQTDAAVNPGNSGGPLVNAEGKLVGMNVAIATAPSRSGEGQNSGISFAIPLTTIDRVVEQIVSGAVVTRGYLGIFYPLDDEANQLALNQSGYQGRGVVVTRVEADSPASKSNIHVGDVILKIDDNPVTSGAILRSFVGNKAPGDKAKVEIWREGKTLTETVTLSRLITEEDKRSAARVLISWGITDIAPTNDGRVFVSDVQMPSPAYRAGVRPQLRIVSIGGTNIKTEEEFFQALAAAGLQQGHDVEMNLETPEHKPMTVTISTK